MQRIQSLDLARGFTVLMIAPIHTVMLYSKLSVRDTLMGKLMAFIAEGPGAQLFMLMMGVFFALAPQKSFLTICKRAFYLIAAAYLLNILKFVLPHYCGLTPPALLFDLSINSGPHGFLQLLLIGDILHFAAMATLVLFSLSRLPHVGIVSVILAIAYSLLSPLFWDQSASNPFLNYLLQLSGGQPPQVFFPFFPWIIYPLIGFGLGTYLKKPEMRQQAFWRCRDIGWLLIILGNLQKQVFHPFPETTFYRTNFDETMIHLGIVLVTLSVWEWIHDNVKPNYFFEILTYMSRNITIIYIIQWILICWLLPLFGYQDLEFIQSLGAITVTSFLTITISFFFKKKPNQNKL